ncbi:TPA: hypothetical protein I8Y21_006267 [Klebsiella oxytoca]|uniref:Uncharacterized protein n=1 Tax=Klebsiella oxytoca TaxID=571 RepID=A0AAN5LEB2_KLEOX|nr:hypothetical protein [Klebsiella oxytoca]
MNITPFLARLISSSVNCGYSVYVSENKIRVKISNDESVIIEQSLQGELYCFISRHGVVSSFNKQMIYDYLFEYDEYGIRVYSDVKGFSKEGV